MKKVLSIICILMLCLPAVAQKKSSSKSSSKSSVAASSYSGGSSRASSVSHQRGSFAIFGNIGYSGGSRVDAWRTGANENLRTRFDPTTVSFDAGVSFYVADRLEVGGSLGYMLQKTWLNRMNGKDLFQRVGLFNISPSIGYHIPICSWFHYVPKATFTIGFGSNINEITDQLIQRGSSLGIDIDLAAANFEILIHKHFSLTLELGGFSYTSLRLNNQPNPDGVVDAQGNIILGTRTTNTFNFNLLNRGLIGFRYYFK